MFGQLYGPVYYILSPNLSGYLKGHFCCKSPLKMVEEWRLSLNNREGVAAVAIGDEIPGAVAVLCEYVLSSKSGQLGVMSLKRLAVYEAT